MNHDIKFKDLRELLLSIGFQEVATDEQTAFRHEASNTLFVFRPYRPGDSVTNYNVIEVKRLLDARGLLSLESFDLQFQKTPA